MSKSSFPLRIQDDERARGKRLAEELGVSENRLYADLIHDGLLIREQMLFVLAGRHEFVGEGGGGIPAFRLRLHAGYGATVLNMADACLRRAGL